MTVGGFRKLVVGVGVIGLGLLGISVVAAEARSVTVRTTSLVSEPGGYLYCKVVAKSATAIGIVARIVDRDGTNVTEFGSGFRASPAVTDDGLFHAEETAGSGRDTARFCKARVTGIRKGDIQVSLQAFDASGTPVATVEWR